MGKFRGPKPVFDDFGRFLGKSVVSEAHSVVSEAHSMAADSHSVGSASHSVPANIRSVVAAVCSVALETNSVTGESHLAVPQRHWMAANGDSPAAEDEFLKTRSCGRHPEAGWRQKNSPHYCAGGETSDCPSIPSGLANCTFKKTRMGVKPFGRNVQPRTAADVLRAGDRPRSVSFGVPRLRGQGW